MGKPSKDELIAELRALKVSSTFLESVGDTIDGHYNEPSLGNCLKTFGDIITENLDILDSGDLKICLTVKTTNKMLKEMIDGIP